MQCPKELFWEFFVTAVIINFEGLSGKSQNDKYMTYLNGGTI